MSRILSTIPNPTPAQARVLGALRHAFGERHELNAADSLAIQNEYHRRRAAGEGQERVLRREVQSIASLLGITFSDARQAQDVASLLSFQNMGAAAQRASECRRMRLLNSQIVELDNLTDVAYDVADDLGDAAPEYPVYGGGAE